MDGTTKDRTSMSTAGGRALIVQISTCSSRHGNLMLGQLSQ